jgi:hypothetical protein
MKTDVISEAKAGEKDRRSIFETKAIAEEGFIYGLPIVMNYTVVYEYALDRNSGQFKAPFNQLIVDPFNAKAQTLLWCGIAQNALSNNGNKNQQMVGKAVQKIFKQWPQ